MAVQLLAGIPRFSSLPSCSAGGLLDKAFIGGDSLIGFLPAAPSRVDNEKFNIIISRRLSGLEEAMRIKRLRELQENTKSRKRQPLRRGKVSRRLPVPDHIPKPPYVGSNKLPELSNEYQTHDDEGIAQMRAACELSARVLDFAGTLVRPSITTDEIDVAVHNMIIDAGAYPSPLGYGGFPKSVCTSVNECMCHGIPDSRQLQDGDIINIDVTVYLNGYHGDTSKTFLCGEVDKPTKQLVKVTEECLERAISVCKDGAAFKKIGKRISEIAEKYGYGVVEKFVGHGVGRVFHSEPIIMHHRGEPVSRENLVYPRRPPLPSIASPSIVGLPEQPRLLNFQRSMFTTAGRPSFLASDLSSCSHPSCNFLLAREHHHHIFCSFKLQDSLFPPLVTIIPRPASCPYSGSAPFPTQSSSVTPPQTGP